MNHETVVANYFAQKAKRNGSTDWKGSRIFSRGPCLFSHGHHFALAIRVPNGATLFLKNGDGVSPSTSEHQRIVQAANPTDPTISFATLHRVLREVFQREKQLTLNGYTETLNPEGHYEHTNRAHIAILDAFKRGHLELLDWQQDLRGFGIFRERPNTEAEWEPWQTWTKWVPKEGRKRILWVRPSPHGTITIELPRSVGADAQIQDANYHLLGAALFRVGTTQWLFTLDESQYCAIELPETVTKVHEAFQCLKPWDVIAAENREEPVKRQGEWFFIPIKAEHALDYWHLARRGRASMEVFARRGKFAALPDDRPTPPTGLRNRHATKWFSWHAPDGIKDLVVLCTDRVKHLHPTRNRLTREHRTLELGSGWWVALRSRELRSLTSSGRGVRFD